MQVSAKSNSRYVKCKSNHLTAFGAELLTPPNKIDFNTVFKKFERLGNNAAVFSTVIVVFVLYIIVVIIIRRADKKDKLKVGLLHSILYSILTLNPN